MPSYAIEYLKKHQRPLQNKTMAGPVFYQAIDVEDFKAELKSESKLNKQSAVAHRDNNRQNAFHFVLQDNLFKVKPEELLLSKEDAKQYIATCETHFSDANQQLLQAQEYLARDKELLALETSRTTGINREHRSDWHPDVYQVFASTIQADPKLCQCKSCIYSKNQIKKYTDSTNEYTDKIAQLTAKIAKVPDDEKSRIEFERHPGRLGGKTVHDIQLPLFVAELLAPFNDDDYPLVQALNAKDDKNSTPLHYAFGVLKDAALFTPLLTRIQQIKDVKHKVALSTAVDAEERNIWHMRLAYGSAAEIKQLIDCFTVDAARAALPHQDKLLNTGLHEVLLPGVREKRAKLEHFCAHVLKVENQHAAAVQLKDVKAAPAINAALFKQNKKGQNPLHMVAERYPEDEKTGHTPEDEIKMLEVIRSLCDAKLYFAKLKEKDNFGNTPLHYIAKHGPLAKLNALFKNLSPEQKQELIAITNKAGETPLHFAVQFGGLDVLEALVHETKPQDLFQMRRASDNFQKQLAKNNQISQQEFDEVMMKHDVLLDTYEYLIRKQQRFALTTDYKARARDFHDCLLSVALDGNTTELETEGEDIPSVADLAGDSKFAEGDTRNYDIRRKMVLAVTKEQAIAFLERLERDTNAAKPVMAARQILWGTEKAQTTSKTYAAMFADRRPPNVVVVVQASGAVYGTAASAPPPESPPPPPPTVPASP